MGRIEELLDVTQRQAGRRRFTFKEVAVIASIVAMLAALAIPYYSSQQARVMHSEVRANLSDLRVMVEAYRSAYGRYTRSLESLLYQQPSGGAYSYWIESAMEDDCVIKAAGKEGEHSKGEVWELVIIDKVAASPHMK
ncbi:type IV pilin protein [Thermodesulfobacteriota bacterium]